MPQAIHYDVWAAPYADGRGAMRLGKGWKEPGQLLRGLRPETDFYLFVVATTQAGQSTPPSAPFHVRLKDLFFQK